MVVNYDKLIIKLKCDPKKTLLHVEDFLINKPYNQQINGLINALLNNTKLKMSRADIKSLVEECLNKDNFDFDVFTDKKIRELLETKNL